MAERNRLRELLRGEKKDFRVKKIKCLYREEGTCGVKNLLESGAISVR